MKKGDNALIIILALAVVIRLIALDQSFWLDEAAQATLSAHNLLNIQWAADFQPPLFYLLTHLWQKWGIAHEWFLRLPSVFFGVSTIYILHSLLRKLEIDGWRSRRPFGSESLRLDEASQRRAASVEHRWDEGEPGPITSATLTALLLATSPFHIYFSQEYRMYSFFTFLVTLSWYLLYRKMFKEYAITVTLMLFTHYFATLVLVSQAVYIVLFQRHLVQQFFKYLALGSAPFIFWLPVLAEQFKTSQQLVSAWPDWSRVAGVGFWKFLGLLLAKFTVGMTSPEPRILYAGVVLIVGSIFLYAISHMLHVTSYRLQDLPLLRLSRQSSQPSRLRLLLKQSKVNQISFLFLVWFIVPVVGVWLSSFWISANSPHRLLFVLPAFYGIIGLGLSQPPGFMKFQQRGFHLISLILFIVVISSNIYFSTTYLFNSRWHREDWRSAVAYTDEKIGKGGIALTKHTAPWAPMVWYSQRPDRYIGASTSMNITQDTISERLHEQLSSIEYPISKVMLYNYLSDLSDPEHRVEEYLKKNGYKLVEEKDFRGVGIIETFKSQ